MRTLLILFASIVVLAPLGAQQVRGVVTDTAGRPLAEAVVMAAREPAARAH